MFVLSEEEQGLIDTFGFVPPMDKEMQQWVLDEREATKRFEQQKKDDELRAQGIAVSLSDLLEPIPFVVATTQKLN